MPEPPQKSDDQNPLPLFYTLQFIMQITPPTDFFKITINHNANGNNETE